MPPTTRHSAYNSLRMQTSQFMTLWKEMSVPPDRRTRGVKSLRMQTSCITTHVDLLKGPSTLAAPHPLDTVHSSPIDFRIPSQSPPRGCLSFFKSFVDSRRICIHSRNRTLQVHDDKTHSSKCRACTHQATPTKNDLGIRGRPSLRKLRLTGIRRQYPVVISR